MRLPERWDDLTYLTQGSDQQRTAYRTLQQLNITEVLRPFSPVLCGTIPLAIDVSGSDLDVICEASDLVAFEQAVRAAYAHRPHFASRFTAVDGLSTCICALSVDGVPVEIFAQPRSVWESNAYRHMVVEARLLALAGPEAAAEIRRLKAQGLKTEPAFGRFLGLDGDPYEILLYLFDAPESALLQVVQEAGHRG